MSCIMCAKWPGLGWYRSCLAAWRNKIKLQFCAKPTTLANRLNRIWLIRATIQRGVHCRVRTEYRVHRLDPRPSPGVSSTEQRLIIAGTETSNAHFLRRGSDARIASHDSKIFLSFQNTCHSPLQLSYVVSIWWFPKALRCLSVGRRC